MKKTIYFLYLLGLILTFKNAGAQIPSLVVTPGNQCQSAVNGNSATAVISPANPAATNYTWVVSSPSSCSVAVYPSGASASIYYYCCGVYTINAFAFNGSSLVGTYIRTVSIECNPLNISSTSNTLCAGSTVSLSVSGLSNYTWMPGGAGTSSITVSPTVSTCYTVSAFSPNCYFSAVKCIAVSNPGTVSISGSSTICAGQYAQLIGSGAQTYTWFPGGIVSNSILTTPSVTTCYTLAGYSACSGLTYAVKCVSVFTAPTVSISAPASICAGQAATLTATGATSYSWYTTAGGSFTGSTIVVTPTATTCYSLTASNGSGCFGYASACVSVSPGSNPVISGNFNLCAPYSTLLYGSGAQTYTWFPSGVVSPSILVTPSVTTCYTLAGYSPCGGLNYAVRCVTVSPMPVLSVSGPTSICAGSGATISVSGASSYTWVTSQGTFSGSTVVLTPSVTSCFTLTGSNGSCYSNYVGCILVSPGSNPVINGNLNVCAGQSVTLYGSGAQSYTWFPSGSVSPSIVVTPSAGVCYTLAGYSSCGGLNYAVSCATGGTNALLSVSGNTVICAGSGATLSASGASSYTWYTSQGTFTGSTIVLTPSATSCYSLVGSNGPGCNGFFAGCISVLSPGSTPSIIGNLITCNGQSTVLYGTGAQTYTWFPSGIISPSIVVTPSTTTCYTLAGYSTCSGLNYAVSCVTPGTSPTLAITAPTVVCAGQTATLSASGASSYTWYTSQGTFTGSTVVITPSVSSCYSLTGSNSGGCTSYSYGCLNILGNLTFNGNLNICNGQSTFLSASGASSYTWFPGGIVSPSIVVTPGTTTCYTLAGYSSCAGLTYAVRCVTVSNSPTLTVSGPGLICAGQTATFIATGATSYTWYTSQGTYTGSTVVLTPTTAGCYSLTGANSIGCTSYAGGCYSVSPGSNPVISGNFNLCAGQSTTLTASGAQTYTWFPADIVSTSLVVTPSVTTCYTLAGYSSCAGLHYAVRCVTVSTPPSLSVSGNTSICSGSGSTLTASGASSYTWYTSQGTFTGSPIVLTPSVTSCYTLVGSNGSGCNGYYGGCISVSPGSNPFISGNFNLCAGQSTTLTASGAQSYTWFPADIVSNTLVVTPSVTTCYTLAGYSPCAGLHYAVRCVTVGTTVMLSVSGNTSICSGSGTTLTASGAASYTWYTSQGTFTGSTIVLTPSATSCYSLVGSSGPSCNGYAGGCINVQSPGTPTISGNFQICYGQSTLLNASGAQSYTWFPMGVVSPSVVLSPTATTCYTLASYSSCGGLMYTTRCVSVTPNLTVSGPSSICPGATATLNASGATSYTWIPGNTTGAGIVVSPTASTCYTVIGTANPNGCVSIGYHCVQVTPGPTITTVNRFFCAGQPGLLAASGAVSYTWLPSGLTGSVIPATLSVSSCYTVIGSNNTGCTNSVVSCFSVFPVPVITVSGNTTICSGASTTLTASGASSYTWFPTNATSSNVVVSPTASTCYTVLGAGGYCSTTSVICVNVQSGAILNISGANSICAGASANLLVSGAATYTWNTGSNSPFITVSPSVSSCYTVVGTTASGCIGYAAKCMSVEPNPTITITGPGSVCAGTGILLNASGASSYSWNTGSTSNFITATVYSTTVYNVTGSNGSCSGNKTYTVVVLPRPNIGIYRTDSIMHDSVLCAGNIAHLMAYGATTYTWNNGATTPYITVSPSVTTTYTVSGTNANGCSNSNVISLQVSACTGLAKLTTNAEIGLYPNPSSGLITFKGDGASKISYSVYDLVGKVVVKGQFTDSKEIDLSAYSNGTYIVRFESGSFSTYQKIILDK